MKTKRIAFIYLTHFPEFNILAAMSFASNMLQRLVALGYHIDIFSAEPDLKNNTSFLRNQPHVTIRKLNMRFPFNININRLQALALAGQILKHGSWDSVFAVGQMGAFLGAIAARRSKCPFVYLNDELPNSTPPTVWRKLELWAVRYEKLLVVVPDGKNGMRCKESRNQFRLPESVPFVAIPNSPIYEPTPKINWKERFKIPMASKIVMHGGSVNDNFQIPELLSTLPYWPEDTVLLIHGRHKEYAERYRKTIDHLELPGRVFWTSDPLPENELHSLISFVDITLALYRNTGLNHELMGMSSGKLMRSLVYGTPVICSSFESLNFITDFGLGIQVKHPVAIPDAITSIIDDLKQYRARCSAFAQKEGSFQDGWRRFQEQFYKTFGNDI